MEVNGWRLFQHPLFKYQYDRLLADTERFQAEQPKTYRDHRTVKLLARITQLISDEIPVNPGHDRYNQGNTLGKKYRHWKRAKFGRYRLFFRYDGKRKAIIYAWINDGSTLRKEGDKNDPYAIFTRGLLRGEPPDSLEQLLKEAFDFDVADDAPEQK